MKIHEASYEITEGGILCHVQDILYGTKYPKRQKNKHLGT